ncbi:MAG TPA: deoxyribonuclease IV [Planctomycetota bacterium]|nr:deoxyribonuclease IV [Planctomycetota bacterium]
MHLTFSSGPALARTLGCQALQIFCGNPRGWLKTPLDSDFIKSFRAGVVEANLDPIIVHATYLINLAARNDEIYQKSSDAFITELKRSHQLGARFYVLHIGNHMGAGPDAGRARVAEAMRRAEREVPGAPEILVENTAGGGTSLGTTFEEVAAVMQAANTERLGLCLDTCHALAAGYDIRTPAGVAQMLDIVDRTVGLKRLRCLHFNDSKGPLGSHLDRHEHIGKGEIGLAGFKALLADKRLWNLPAILETPKELPTSDVDNLWLTIELALAAGAVKNSDVGTRPIGVETPSDAPKTKAAKPVEKKKRPERDSKKARNKK